ncbi:MAG: hypothetical protein Q9165_004714 [Trypethelium subeluteriae]
MSNRAIKIRNGTTFGDLIEQLELSRREPRVLSLTLPIVPSALYKEKKSKSQSQSQSQPKTPTNEQSRALVPHKAYVEDAPDPETNGTIAIIDVPPRAPSPPPAAAALQGQPVNVFDFLITDDTPSATKTSLPPVEDAHLIEDKAHESVISDQPPAYTPAYHSQFMYSQPPPMPMDYGYSYGSAPLEPSFERYDSYADLPSAHQQYVTPAPKRERDTSSQRDGENDRKKGSKSEKRRKRNHIESLDLSLVRSASQDEVMTDAPPPLHSGLTGGLNRLMSRAGLPPSPEYSGEASGPSPTKPRQLKKDRPKTDKKDKAKSQKAKSEKSHSSSQDKDAQPRKTSASSTTHSSRHHHHHHHQRSERSQLDDDNNNNSPPRHNGKRHRHHHHRHPRHHSNSPPQPPRKQLKAIEYPRSETSAPAQSQQLVPYYQPNDRATHFLSFVNKGPDSERGCSMNKALKRWHRERGSEGGSQGGSGRGGTGGAARSEKWEEEKELWKSLRLRRNERGEIVVFI